MLQPTSYIHTIIKVKHCNKCHTACMCCLRGFGPVSCTVQALVTALGASVPAVGVGVVTVVATSSVGVGVRRG